MLAIEEIFYQGMGDEISGWEGEGVRGPSLNVHFFLNFTPLFTYYYIV